MSYTQPTDEMIAVLTVQTSATILEAAAAKWSSGEMNSTLRLCKFYAILTAR